MHAWQQIVAVGWQYALVGLVLHVLMMTHTKHTTHLIGSLYVCLLVIDSATHS